MKNKRNNILVTGATGYIGYNFSKYIVEKGFVVHILVRKNSDLKDLENIKGIKIHYYNGKSDSIELIFNKNQIDFVFHLATYYDKSDDSITLRHLNDVCIGVTTQLFEVIKKQKYFIGFINVGTIWQTHRNIANAYTLYKAFQEELVKFFSNKYKTFSLSLLLNDTYGPDDLRPKLVNQIKSSIREKKELSIINPNVSINLIYIDDVCDALYHSISLIELKDNHFKRFKLEAKMSLNLKDLIDLCETISCQPINVTYGTEASFSKIVIAEEVEVLPGWEPKIELTNGISRFLEDKE